MPFPKADPIPKSFIRFLEKKIKKGIDIRMKDKPEEDRIWRTPTKSQVEQLMIKMRWKMSTIN